MSDKTSLLQDILFSLDDDDTQMIEKTATDANTLKNTENSEAVKKVSTEAPHKSEKKLGLSVLGKNKFQDDIRTLAGVEANKRDKQGTEDINVNKPSVEPGLVFEKKASEDVISTIYEAAGVDLQKVASEENIDDMLLKVAEDTLAEMQDLEKVAEALAEETANRFIAKLEQI